MCLKIPSRATTRLRSGEGSLCALTMACGQPSGPAPAAEDQLQTVFRDGEVLLTHSVAEIRERAAAQEQVTLAK